VIGPEAFVDGCVRKGVTCIAVTDHNEIEGAFVIEKLAAERAEGRLKVVVRGQKGAIAENYRSIYC
jgi:predicted metal-dependent phosphoesterase TrpH